MSEDCFAKNQEKFDPRIFAFVSAINSLHIPENDTRSGTEKLKDLEKKLVDGFSPAFGPHPVESDQGELHTIKGIDGNSIEIKLYRPPSSKVEDPKKIPAIVYLHGGGMAVMRMKDYESVYRIISSHGLLVVAVDFRNSTESPFPAGLNDCLSAVIWTHEHAQELNIDTNRLVVGGESGGGNLSAATCLKANSLGISIIKGQCLLCPYLSPEKRHKSRHKYSFPNIIDIMTESYTNSQEYSNYLAWPINATVDQLRGLPPALVITNQFDNLVNEGEDYAAKLMQAGVKVLGFRSLGTLHGSVLMNGVVPDLVNLHWEMLVSWVKSLG